MQRIEGAGLASMKRHMWHLVVGLFGVCAVFGFRGWLSHAYGDPPAADVAPRPKSLPGLRTGRANADSPPADLPTLLNDLNSETFAVRWDAIETIEGLGPSAKAAVPALAKALADGLRKNDEILVTAVLRTLSGIGPEGEAAAISALRDRQVLRLPLADDSTLRILPRLQNLRTLDVSETRISDEAMRYIGRLANLEELTLEGTHVSDKGLVHIRSLTKLLSVDLMHTPTSDDALNQISNPSRLRRLSVGARYIGRGPAIAAFKNLEDLSFCYSLASDSSLAQLHVMANLKILSLVDTGVTDAGLAHLACLTGLEVLQLNQCPVTDAGMKHLANLRNLKYLSLSETKVTDAGLGQLTRLRKLEEFCAGRSPITVSGAKEFQKKMPNLKHLDTGN